MIESFFKSIIDNLGVVGLLVVGLYVVLGQYLKKISDGVTTINHNSTKIAEIIERCADRICDKLDGKN